MFILPFTYRNPNLATCYFTLLQVYIHVKDVQQPLAIVWKMEIGCFWYHWHKSKNIFCVNKACLKVAQSIPMSEDTSIQYALELAV